MAAAGGSGPGWLLAGALGIALAVAAVLLGLSPTAPAAGAPAPAAQPSAASAASAPQPPQPPQPPQRATPKPSAEATPPPTPGRWPDCSSTLPVVDWDHADPTALSRILALRQPTLLRNAPSSAWPAQNWTFTSLQTALPSTIPSVIVSRTPRLLFYNKAFPMFKDQPPFQNPRRWREPYAVRNLSSEDFFKLAQNGGGGPLPLVCDCVLFKPV